MVGKFVISLDFEKHWGVFDNKTVDDYRKNLENVDEVIDRLMTMSERYGIKLTFSTVGLLFAKNRDELINYIPINKPTYKNQTVNPYIELESHGENQYESSFHYAPSLINKIKQNGNHEIGTHTFSHFYCHAPGQTVAQFDDDLNAAMTIAKPFDLELKSIVFPKNQINPDEEIDKPYLHVCKKHGITSFRGKEKSFIYNIHSTKKYRNLFIFRALKPLDAYINITGSNTYKLREINKDCIIYNIPSSRFLRPYNTKLKLLEPLKIRRIRKAMTYAAKNNEVYHLWWHPHNFGTNMNQNFNNLEIIFNTYRQLNQTYGFQSDTMTGLTNKLKVKS